MSKLVRIQDDTYELLVGMAKEQDRSIAYTANFAIADYFVSGGYDQHKKDSRVARAHIVKEGQDLGILPKKQAKLCKVHGVDPSICKMMKH